MRSAASTTISPCSGTSPSVFSTTGAWAKAHPAEVAAFQRSLAEAVAYSREHEKEVRDSIAHYTKLPPQVVAALPLPNMQVRMGPPQLADWAQIALDQGLITKMPDVSKLVAAWPAD